MSLLTAALQSVLNPRKVLRLHWYQVQGLAARAGNGLLPWEAHLLPRFLAIAVASLFCAQPHGKQIFFLIQYSHPSLSLDVSFHTDVSTFPQMNSNLVLKVLILQVSLPICYEIAINKQPWEATGK